MGATAKIEIATKKNFVVSYFWEAYNHTCSPDGKYKEELKRAATEIIQKALFKGETKCDNYFYRVRPLFSKGQYIFFLRFKVTCEKGSVLEITEQNRSFFH